MVDLSYALDRDASVRLVTPDGPEALHALSAQHCAPAGRGGASTCSPARSAASVRRPTRASSTTSSSTGPFVPEDLDAIEAKMKDLAQQDLPYERQLWPRDEAKAFFAEKGEPLKVQLIDEKTEGQSEVSCYTIKDKDTFVDFCVGPHVPSTGKLKAFKLLSDVERLLEGRREEPADAAHLRHGVLQRDGPEGAPAAARRGEEARPPEARARAGPLHVPPLGAGRRLLARQGHDALQHARQLHARRAASQPATSR